MLSSKPPLSPVSLLPPRSEGLLENYRELPAASEGSIRMVYTSGKLEKLVFKGVTREKEGRGEGCL